MDQSGALDISGRLMKEHELILRYATFVEWSMDAWEQESGTDDRHFANLAQVLDFIRTYADAWHHAKEEDILFRHLAEPGVLQHCNPLPVMLDEHDEGRQYVAQVAQAIQARSKPQAISNIRAWARLLTNHIYKEDNVLYVMAEEGLSAQAKARICAAYQQANERLGGDDLDRRYQALLEQLDPPA